MAMYYDDLAAMEEEMCSSLCTLADVAAMLYEEEHSKCHTKKTLSEEEEEESDKRVFHLFPRKKRTWVKNFVARRRRNLSSSLLDLNKIPIDSHPRSLLQWPSSSSSLFLGCYKIAADYETKNPQNPPSSSASLVDYNTKSPPNPNSQSSPSSCLTENRRSRKRRAVKQRKRSNGKSKKAKVAHLSWKGRETPKSLVKLMENMNGSDLKLIFERSLYETDVNPGESRLSMPFNHLIRSDFLTPVESRIIEEDINNVNKIGVGAILVDQRSEKYGVILKRWEMKKESGKGSWNYSLTCGWNDVVRANGLEENDGISVWSFRWREVLCFAIVPPPTMEQCSSSLALCL